MKWNCDMIQDLLPLYQEGLCSPTSRAAVEEHLRECPACRALARELPSVEPPPELPKADQAVAKSIKKVKRRWQTSLIAMLLVVPILLLSVNQFLGRGICWTNADDLFLAWRYVHALETQNWDRAAQLHDYSNDYDSILEALSLPLDAWGSTFTPVTLDGETWMLRSYLDCNALDERADFAIFGFLYNRVGQAMVPAALWERVIAVDPGAVQQDGYQYWLNDEYYAQVTTPWGEFVISDGKRCATAADYCARLDLVPEEVYLEAKADLAAEALEIYTATHQDYGYVEDMTAEEFDAYMTEDFAADLKKLESLGCTIDCTGYHSSYRHPENGGWNIVLQATVSLNDEPVECYLDIGIRDGKVYLASLSHRQQADWLDEVSELLSPSAHPDY